MAYAISKQKTKLMTVGVKGLMTGKDTPDYGYKRRMSQQATPLGGLTVNRRGSQAIKKMDVLGDKDKNKKPTRKSNKGSSSSSGNGKNKNMKFLNI